MKIHLLLHESERDILDYFEKKGTLDEFLAVAVRNYLECPTAHGFYMTSGDQQPVIIAIPESVRKAIVRKIGFTSEPTKFAEVKRITLAAIAQYCTRIDGDRLKWRGTVRNVDPPV